MTYRARDHVLRCLASLREHVTLPYEAIVVDDGSGDGTPEAVREAFPEAVVVAKIDNEGLSFGRNDGLAHVSGRFVLMLDSDTLVRPGAVEALVRTLDERPEAGLVAPRLVYPNGELQLSCRRYPPFLAPFVRRGPVARILRDPPSHRRHLMKEWPHDATREVVWVAGAAQMYRADLPRLIGPYDTNVSSYGGEDLDWCLRVWDAGLTVLYVAEAEIVHVFQQVTRKNLYSRKAFRALRDWYYLQWKHRRLRRDRRLAEAVR